MLPPQETNKKSQVSEHSLEIKIPILANELLAGVLKWGFSIPDLLACYQQRTSLICKDTKELATSLQDRITEELTSDLIHNLRIRTTYNGTGLRPWVHGVLSGHSPLHIPEHLLVINHLFGSIAKLNEVWSTLQKT